MPIYTGTVIVSADDFYYLNGSKQAGTNTLISQENNFLSNAGNAVSNITVALDLSTNPVVTASTLHWYDVSYVVSPTRSGPTVDGRINFNGNQIYQFTSDPTDNSWNQHDLESSELNYINLSGTNYFSYIVPDPGSSWSRTWTLGAKENSTSAYLVVEYTTGSTIVVNNRRRIIIIS